MGSQKSYTQQWTAGTKSTSRHCSKRKGWNSEQNKNSFPLRSFDLMSKTECTVQLFSRVWLFATPWTTACQTSLSIANSQSLPKLIHWVSDGYNHLILCISFPSCLQTFPASGSFLMSQLFASGGQSIGLSASASVLLVNTQDWSPLRQTGWISLHSKGLSRVFFTPQFKHQLFDAQLSL